MATVGATVGMKSGDGVEASRAGEGSGATAPGTGIKARCRDCHINGDVNWLRPATPVLFDRLRITGDGAC